MRKAFATTLFKLMKEHENILLLTADLGFMVWDAIMENFPERFINVGVAEQNMVGMATGLAEAGYIPFIYSIATFAVLRPYEFIRNGPILHQLPIRIVGMGGGYEYGAAGITHHSLEDIGVMRIQPGMMVIAPADSAQTTSALQHTYHLPTPIYYRLGKNDDVYIPSLQGRFTLGGLEVIREGKDLLWIAVGGIALEVTKAAELLTKQGINSTVIILASIKPAPIEELATIIARYSLVFTVEAHYQVGGVGSLVAEIIAQRQINSRLICKGVPDISIKISGSSKFYDQSYGLNAECLMHEAIYQFKNNKQKILSYVC